MTSSMISHENLIAPLSVADKPSIENPTQLLIQSEHMSMVPTPRSPDLPSGGQSSGPICTFSNTLNISNDGDHQNLSFSSNPRLLNIDVKSTKILNPSNNSGISLRALSPPILSESCSDTIQSSASIKGNYVKDSHISDNIKFNNEGDCFSDKSDLSFQSKIDGNIKILQHEQNITNLRDISTPSPPNVPFPSNENQAKPELITMNNFVGESNKKMNGYENQVSPVYYQNGYPINSNSHDNANYSNFSSNPQYYGNSMQAPLYAQYTQQNSQFIPPNQKVPQNAYYKQQKNMKTQKSQYQQMCLWQSQQQNQQQYPGYQYFRYPNPQMQPMNLNNYNMYGNYQQISPAKNELSSSNYLHQSFGSNNLSLKPNVYQSGRISPNTFPTNFNMPTLPYQMPNQEQQQYLYYEDNRQIVDSSINNQNDPQSNSLNHDSTMSSKMNLMMNCSAINQDNLNQSISKSEISFSQTRAPKQRNNSSKSLLKATSHYPHYHHHHHHQTPNTELVPPNPIYYNDKELGKYGIRCICGKGSITTGCDPASSTDSRSSNTKTKSKKSKKGRSKQIKATTSTPSSSEISAIKEADEVVEKSDNLINESCELSKYSPNSIKTTTLLVQCDICHFWLHGLCVNVARVEENDSFTCPFCENKRIFCTKCNENMNYSTPLIKCTKCGYWVHKECEGLIFGINPQNFVCRNCGGLGEDAVYDIPYVKFIEEPHSKHQKKDVNINPVDISLLLNNNNNENKENDDEDINLENCNEVDLDTFFELEIPDLTVFTSSLRGRNEGSSDLIENESFSQILESIPDGIFKQAVLCDLNKSELEYRSTIEKYFHEFAPLLFDYSHEFWRVFKDTLSKLLKVDTQTILKSIDSLANHLIYMPTNSLSIKQQLNENEENFDADEKIFFKSNSDSSFVHSESITKYLDGLNMTRLEKQPNPINIYCNKKDGRVYSTASLDDNSFICDIPGFLMHTDEVRVEDEGIPKNCFLVTDMDLVIDTKGTDFEFFAPRIRRGFHFNAVVKLVRIQGEIRLGLFAMKMKALLSSEEKLKKGPAIFENGEIILPLDGTIPFPVQKIQWKDKKKHQKSANNENSINNGKLNSNLAVKDSNDSYKTRIKKNDDDDSEDEDDDNESNSLSQSKTSNQSIIMTRNQEKRKKAELKLEKKNRDEQISKLSLLSSFYDDSVQAFPFILLDDDEAVEKYKSKMEMKASKTKNGKGKR